MTNFFYRHGTRCAGVIAMVANNNWCGVGIAPDSKIGGVRMLDGPVTELVESKTISFNVKNIDIMSASWGPSDNGRMVDGPGKLVTAAFNKGIHEVRLPLAQIQQLLFLVAHLCCTELDWAMNNDVVLDD